MCVRVQNECEMRTRTAMQKTKLNRVQEDTVQHYCLNVSQLLTVGDKRCNFCRCYKRLASDSVLHTPRRVHNTRRTWNEEHETFWGKWKWNKALVLSATCNGTQKLFPPNWEQFTIHSAHTCPLFFLLMLCERGGVRFVC